MNESRGPDFFIVGAPKCGTTAMAHYLAQHPSIGMCPRKETHFFADDLRERFAVKRGQQPPSREQYMSFFAGLEDRARLGEASVWYLYSEAAPIGIRDFCQDAQIIVMLRSPLEMIPSLHSQFVYVGLEPVEDLALALSLDDERERSGTPPGFPPRSYRAAVDYATQVRRYLDAFGAERVHVIPYDRFREDTIGVVKSTFEFLGVDPGFDPRIEVVNANKQVRSRLMRRVVRRPPEAARRVLHAITTTDQRRSAGRLLKRWNTRYVPRDALPPEVIDRLQPLAERQSLALRDLLGLELDAWREPVAAQSAESARGDRNW